MSFLNKAKSAAEQARAKAARVAAERGDAIRTGLDKAGHAVDQRTGGKYRDRIEKVKGTADSRLQELASEHARTTRQDPVSAEARVVGDQEVAAEGLQAPGVDERDERARNTVPDAAAPDAAAPDVSPTGTDPEVARARGSRLYGGTAPGGVSPEAPRPDGDTPGGPAPGSSR